MKLLIFFTFFLLNFNLFSQEIRTIDLMLVINSNDQYNDFLTLLDIKKNDIKSIITNKEKKIITNEEFIENNKLIIDENELNTRLDSLNKDYSNLETYINRYNYYFDQNININKNLLINKIAEITKNISIEENIDIVFDKSNFFIASNDIDITNLLLIKIKNLDINFKIFTEDQIFEN